MKSAVLLLCLLVPQVAKALQGATRPPDGPTTQVDYRRDESWLCRPGTNTELCTGDLEATAVGGESGGFPAASANTAATPSVDCFYIYPTASEDRTFYSGLHRERWVDAAVHEQVARLSSACRVFAPFYHQLTSAGLNWQVRHGALTAPGLAATLEIMQGVPYRDVLAAWRDYLLHDNHGRGVVLIGHSQGAIILKKLLAEEIDGKPSLKLLVAAYLAGNPDLGTGDFHSLQTCRTRTQTGCLVAWSSYPADYTGQRFFGRATHGEPLCVNPAGLGEDQAAFEGFPAQKNGSRCGLCRFPRKHRTAAWRLPCRRGWCRPTCICSAGPASDCCLHCSAEGCRRRTSGLRLPLLRLHLDRGQHPRFNPQSDGRLPATTRAHLHANRPIKTSRAVQRKITPQKSHCRKSSGSRSVADPRRLALESQAQLGHSHLENS